MGHYSGKNPIKWDILPAAYFGWYSFTGELQQKGSFLK